LESFGRLFDVLLPPQPQPDLRQLLLRDVAERRDEDELRDELQLRLEEEKLPPRRAKASPQDAKDTAVIRIKRSVIFRRLILCFTLQRFRSAAID
jgi:hypothetical protein